MSKTKATNIESYSDLTNRQSRELNAFEGIFYAFSNDQFYKGMEKVGLKRDETGKLCKMPHGGFILKDRAKAYLELIKRHSRERKEARANEKHLFEALVYELGNYEYCYTFDASDALEAIGVTEDELPAGMLKKAIKEHMRRFDDA